VKIIVTGALGHIGSAFIRNPRLQSKDIELVLIDDFSTQRYSSLFHLSGPKIRLIEGHVLQTLTPKLASSADAIVHLAAIADPGFSIVNPDEVHAHNLGVTEHAIKVCLVAGVPLVFPSSTSIYGGTSTQIIENIEKPQPHTPYAKCKVAEEEAIHAAFEDNLSGAILRFGTIFGVSPGMRFHTAVNRFCWQASIGSNISVYRNALHQLRPYLAVEDASDALAHTVLDGFFHRSSINIASCNTTVSEILDLIRVAVPNLRVGEIDSPAMNENSFGVSTARAIELGYTFSGNIEDGIRKTLDLLSGVRA